MDNLNVEVIFVGEHDQYHERLEVKSGATIDDAIQASALLERFPALSDSALVVGVFGKKLPLSHKLTGGDRVEVYRPLIIDPKEARRQRAEKKRKR